MPVTSNTAKVSYAGDGTSVSFAVSFRFLANSHVQAVLRSAAGVETTWVEGTDYSLTGAGSDTGGTLVATTAPASGTTLVISRSMPFTQNTDFVDNDPLPASSLDDGFDARVMEVQQLKEASDRSLKLPISESGVDTELPSPEANKALTWNSGATALQNSDITTGNTIAFANRVIETATGDGATVAFTLTTAPAQDGNLDVYLDGVHQADATYTLVGTTVTFTTAPASGAGIEFRYGQTAATAAVDDAAITTAKLADGAVTTAKLAATAVTTAKIAAGAVTTTGLGALAVTDAKVNDVAWSKVTSTPTTLAGYGITDAASDAELATHEADTSTHGVGVIVGTTEAQSVVGKTSLGIGISSSLQGLTHIKSGVSGATSADAVNTALVLEGSAGTAANLLQFLSPDNSTANILFGDATSAVVGRISYVHSGTQPAVLGGAAITDRLLLWQSNTAHWQFDTGSFLHFGENFNHGITDTLEDYAAYSVSVASPTNGGYSLHAGSKANTAIILRSLVTTETTARASTLTNAPTILAFHKKNLTGTARMSAGANLIAVQTYDDAEAGVIETEFIMGDVGDTWHKLTTKSFELVDADDGGAGTPGTLTVKIGGNSHKVPTVGGTAWTMAGFTCADLGTVTTADINGGTIDGVAIGGASPAAGAFTTITSSGNCTFGDAGGTDTVRVVGGLAAEGSALPATGASVVTGFGLTAGEGHVLAFDHGLGVWEELRVRGKTLHFDISGSEKASFDANGRFDTIDQRIKEYDLVTASVSSSAGTATFDLANGRAFSITLTENVTTVAFSNVPTGAQVKIMIKITQDAAVARTVTWPAAVKWAGGTAHVMSTGLGDRDRIVLVTEDGGTTWDAGIFGQVFS